VRLGHSTPPADTAADKSLHYAETGEDMVQLWEEDTDGSKLKNHYVRSQSTAAHR